MKKVYSVCFCGLLTAITANQVLAMRSTASLITQAQILELSSTLNKKTKIESPEIEAYLIEKKYPGKIELKIYALIPYIDNPAHGSPVVLVNLLRIKDWIHESALCTPSISIDEIIDQVKTDPSMHKIDCDIISYMHYLMIEEGRLEDSDEEILEAICDTSALKKFKIRNMQKAYLEKKGYSQDAIDSGLEHIEEYAATCGLISEEPGKFTALLALVDWMRNESIKNPKTILSKKQTTTIMIKLRDELPNVYDILNKDILEFDDMIKNLHRIMNEVTYEDMSYLSPEEQNLLQDKIILEILEFDLEQEASQLEQAQMKLLKKQGCLDEEFASKLQDMQEYTNCFKSVFQKPEMFNPLLDVVDKALFYLNANGALSSDELAIKIKRTVSTSNIDEGVIMQIHYLITEKNLLNKDDIVAQLDEMNKSARKIDVMAHLKGFDLFDHEVEPGGFTPTHNYQLSSLSENSW